MRETEIAAAVCAWFRVGGFTVWQEVQTEAGGWCADIVARHGSGPPHVVECKRRLTVALLAQIERWRQHSVNRWIAIETPMAAPDSGLLDRLGIGLICVSENVTCGYQNPQESRQAPLESLLLAALRPEQQTYAPAGTASGKRFTPEMAALSDLSALVTREGEVTLKAAVGKLRHPWPTSARAESELRRLLRKGACDGVRMRKVRGRWVLRSEEATF